MGRLVPSHPFQPDGKPIIGCMRNAIVDAGLNPDDIDDGNPHGTGTLENDKTDIVGVSAVSRSGRYRFRCRRRNPSLDTRCRRPGTVEAVITR